LKKMVQGLLWLGLTAAQEAESKGVRDASVETEPWFRVGRDGWAGRLWRLDAAT
jgi:hypothetical protein